MKSVIYESVPGAKSDLMGKFEFFLEDNVNMLSNDLHTELISLYEELDAEAIMIERNRNDLESKAEDLEEEVEQLQAEIETLKNELEESK